MGFAGVVGLWGIGFFSFDLLAPVLRAHFESRGMSATDVSANVAWWIGVTSVVQNIGGFFGIYAYAYLTHYVGRKPAFFAAFLAAMFSTAMVFAYLNEFSEIFWMIPIMGFCQLALFGGYAIYFPELFPTRLRSTGTSFCYNVGRFVAAAGPLTLGFLTKYGFNAANGFPEGIRWAGVTMCSVFLIGLIVLPFAPETRGKPLPE
jgi:MFS family permease